MKYLIVGLGNIGEEYANTRHNAGFIAVDKLVSSLEAKFTIDRLAYRAEGRFKGRTLIMIKPTTYMNLSGKSVKYWMNQENIPLENVLIIVDDIALPLGTLRLKKGGSDAGHNGLINIFETLGTKDYPRLRFGIGSDFSRGKQIDYVLGRWKTDEEKVVTERAEMVIEIVKSFVTQGIDRTMNAYNNK